MEIFNIIESFINLSPEYEKLLRTSTDQNRINHVDQELTNLYHRYRALLENMTTSEIETLKTMIINKINELKSFQRNEEQELTLSYYEYYIRDLQLKIDGTKRI